MRTPLQIFHPSRVTFAANGAQSKHVRITVFEATPGFKRSMSNKALKDVKLYKRSITVTVAERMVLFTGDTLTINFDGEIVPVSREEYDALVAYRDWRIEDDPRGQSKESRFGVPTSARQDLVHHAGPKWLWHVYLGLSRLLSRKVLRD